MSFVDFAKYDAAALAIELVEKLIQNQAANQHMMRSE
jgi:hypothetical protein